MLEQINQEIKNAMKAKASDKLSALRYLKSMLMENSTSKSPRPEMDVIISHVKKLKDSLENYPKESDQYQKLVQEIMYVEVYLPQQLSEQEVVKFITDIITKLDNPNMGGVMKELSPLIKGKFDGKKATELVLKELA
ncbi:MAG: GatB/YqeY domain-containing protein [Halobacteriovoraceae bacterium]|nr:GatB/YqeY domain-containing protein [Halobacteriovoraceae bacterium]